MVAALVAAATMATPSASAAERTIWVDPVKGKDSRSGATKGQALRSLTAAWNKIPEGTPLTQPVTIMVRAGEIPASRAPNYWEKRYGTASAPITIRSADGPLRAGLPSINMFDVRHFKLDGVKIRSKFDTFHCEQCSHITLDRSAFVGIGNYKKDQGPQETIKLNQSDHITITDSYIAGATDNAIDMVAVNVASIRGNTIAHALDWCTYAKGGSSDVEYIGNDVHHCGTGGITIGQGTGFEFMRAPWLHYEAYGSRVINNVVHDTQGAALGVNGGYDILVAHNTAYRVGTRDHVLEVVYGERSCDGNAVECAARRALGGWGPAAPGGDAMPIGNQNVALFHNLVFNPAGVQSQWQHFAVYQPRATGSGGSAPDPAVADTGLLIRGNAIWNGPADLALGLGSDDQGCQPGHPTCAPDTMRADNNINGTQPPVRVIADGIPVPTGAIAGGVGAGAALPAFDWTGLPAGQDAPVVTMPTSVATDRAGRARAGSAWAPGAYLAAPATTAITVATSGRPGSVAVRGASTKASKLSMVRGDWVELTARAKPGSRFASWGGACTGQSGPVCLVRAKGARMTVVARFRR